MLKYSCQSWAGHLDQIQLTQKLSAASAGFWLGPYANLAGETCRLMTFENNSSQWFSFYG